MMGGRTRPFVALVAALSALLLAVVPLAAAEEIHSSGSPGPYEVFDEEGLNGANCLYETGSTDLDSINVRGPRNVHGVLGPTRQWVGYRFMIQRDAPPTGDGYRTVHKGPTRFRKADDNENPVSFARRSWTAPESPSGDYRVLVVLLWYKANSHAPAARTGKVVLRYEWYKQLWNGTFDQDTDYCSPQYS